MKRFIMTPNNKQPIKIENWYYLIMLLYFLVYIFNSFIKDINCMIFATGIYLGALIWNKK